MQGLRSPLYLFPTLGISRAPSRTDCRACAQAKQQRILRRRYGKRYPAMAIRAARKSYRRSTAKEPR
jgi:hypothetical protein